VGIELRAIRRELELIREDVRVVRESLPATSTTPHDKPAAQKATPTSNAPP
jgi:hypothetical protein